MYPQQQPQPLPPPVPPVIAPPKPPMSRVLHFIVMVLVGIVLLAVGAAAGYYFRDYQASQQANSTVKSDSNQTAEPTTTTPEVDEETTRAIDGIQAKSRDTERQTDINSVAIELEAYFNAIGAYPNIDYLQNETLTHQYLKDLDVAALRTPGNTANAYQNTDKPDKDHYGYQPLKSDYSPCTSTVCDKFVLYWHKESPDEIQQKTSIN